MDFKTSNKVQDLKASRRKNNAGTFNIDNPKKIKKIPKQAVKKEKKLKSNGNSSMESLAEHDASGSLPMKKRRSDSSNFGDQEPGAKRFKSSTFNKGSKDLSLKKSKLKTSKNSQLASEKPNWNDFKKEKKALRDKRRAAECEGDTYDVSIKAKKRYENIKIKNCPKDLQLKELNHLHSLLKGKLLSVVYAHDMSRVIQSMLKLAHTHKQTSILNDMIQELMEDFAGMSKKKYSIHVAKTIIDVAPDSERNNITKAFQGRVMKFLSHSVGNTAIKQVYSKLKPSERHLLQRELYGGSVKMITSEPVTSLEVIFKVLPHMKEQTLNNTRENLSTLFEKNAVDSPMVHAVLLDYLSQSKAADISTMLESAQEHIKVLATSRDGVHVVMMSVWMGTPKARKKIVKELRGEVANLACGEHTHMLLLSIFDCVDDTKLIEKVIIPELIQDTEKISLLLGNTFGRKILSYLCSRRDPRLFSAPVVALLSQGDNNPHSKKDADVRALELQNMVLPKLLTHIAENASQWIDNHSNLIVLLIVLKSASGGELESAFLAIAKHIVSPLDSASKNVDLSRADDTACHLVLKKIAEHDSTFAEKGLATFGAALLGELKDKHITTWLTNNHCCFLLLAVLKNGAANVVEKLSQKIKKLHSKAWINPESIPVGGKRIKEFLSLN